MPAGKIIMRVAVAAALLWAGPARAEEVRFPETGGPAFDFQVPDDWVTTTDNDGNMEVAQRIKNVTLVLSIGADATANLDDYAARMLKAAGADPAGRKETAMLGGHAGAIYYSAMDNSSDPSGLRIAIRLTLVKPDAGSVASCALLIDASASEADIAASQAVETGIKIVP
jgi:hypothetical protein